MNLYQIFSSREKEQKKILGIYIGNFETYSRYSRVADEEQKKGHRGDCLFKFSEGDDFKRVWETLIYVLIKNL